MVVARPGVAILTAVSERLDALFTAYLASGRGADAAVRLAPALEAAGYALEAAALLATETTRATRVNLPGSVGHGRRLWTGGRLPVAARVGDVWLDTCQLTPRLLVPRENNDDDGGGGGDGDGGGGGGGAYAWLDLRPVHNWQYATLLALARFTPRETQLDPPLRLLDPLRAVAKAFLIRVRMALEVGHPLGTHFTRIPGCNFCEATPAAGCHPLLRQYGGRTS